MKRTTFSLILICGLILSIATGCRSHTMPEDFDICFQFGTTDANTVTIDTYNELITLGTDQTKRMTFKMSKDDKADIYDRMTNDLIQGYKGEYRSTKPGESENIKFSIKYTSRKHTSIISGDYTTINYAKKKTETLLDFRDYMMTYVKGLKEYGQIIG